MGAFRCVCVCVGGGGAYFDQEKSPLLKYHLHKIFYSPDSATLLTPNHTDSLEVMAETADFPF